MKTISRSIILFLAIIVLSNPSSAQLIEDSSLQSKTAGWLNESGFGFLENKGQLKDQKGKPNAAVRYLLTLPGLKVQLRATGFSYDTWVEASAKRTFHRVDIELEGANAGAVMTPAQPSTEVTNVINELGAFEGIRNFGKVTYQNIYPGIDLEFVARNGTDKPVEYNFIVHPGADASRIRMKYKGQNSISLRQDKIEMALNHGKLSEHIPASWIAGTGEPLTVSYVAKDKNIYAFNIPAYNKKETLIIDPTPNLEWATFYGGTAIDQISSVATDSEGNIYVSGFTASTANIATGGAYDGTYGGGVTGANPNEDAFIAKFTTSGQRVWGTYYGADGRDSATAIVVKGNVIIVGGTTRSTGMATAGAHQTVQTAANQPTGFLAKFDATTGLRTWGTYYGGSIRFQPARIAIDDQDNFYAYGSFLTHTQTPTGVDIATPGTFRPTLPASADIVINQVQTALVKFNAAGVRQWGTYVAFSRSNPSVLSYVGALALDADGQPYVTGGSSGSDLAANAPQGQSNAGSNDAFIVKINKANGQRTWGRYFGGIRDEYMHDIYIDNAGQTIYGVGSTRSASGISTPGAFLENVSPALESTGITFRTSFFASFDLNGVQKMGTYLIDPTLTGITAITLAVGITQDSQGNLNILGYTTDPKNDLGTNCTYRPEHTNTDVFITNFTQQGQRVWGTYLGSAGSDIPFGLAGIGDARGKSIAMDPQGNIIVVYNTPGTDAATTGSHQPNFGGGTHDGVISKLNTGGPPPDVKVTGSTLNPMSQTTCILGIPATITGNAVSLYNPPGFTSPIFYQWQVADAPGGPWTDLGGEVFKDLQPLSSQTSKYYRRMVLVNGAYCDTKAVDSSAVAEVLVNSNVAPIANADGPQWYVCAGPNNTVTLNGSASGGSGVYSSYQWYAGSNLATPVFTGTGYTPTVTTTTTYTLKVTDNAGCIDVDQVTVTPVIADAGPDVSQCQGNGGVQIGTPGIPGGAVTYSWSTVSGSPVTTLSCTNCAQPVANPTVNTTYRVTTTVTRKGGVTCFTTNDVIVTVVAAPGSDVNFAGVDRTICKGTPIGLGIANDAAATYSWSPTTYLSASNISNPTFDAGTNPVKCPMVYTVTATKGGCTFTDQVNVNVVDPSTSLDNQTLNCEGWSSGNTNNCSNATYTWQLVSGPGVVPTGNSLRNGNADAYLVNNGATNAVYRRVTTVNGVNCNSANITISPCSGTLPEDACPAISIAMMSPQGCPKVFGSQELQFRVNGINAADYNFSWTPANIMDNPTAPIVNITSTTAVTINVTVTNKYSGRVCTAPGLPINNPSWSLPVLNVSDKATCPSAPVSIGEPSAAGFSYAWTPALGLSSATVGNPVATIIQSQAFQVTKTDNASGCKTTGTVSVAVSEIIYDAGIDRAICNGATVTLGTTPGGSYTYSWTPIDAAWTNGTGPTDANPQVLFAGSSQTFNVTITDPLTGCQKTDAVTLRGTVLPGEYAGAAPTPPLCPGETYTLGAEAIPNATYEWSPATGLSCTDCAHPVATAGTANQTYTVLVSYPGCATPVTDEVTITVNSLPNVVLTDKTICPTTPTNIGIGGAGNTASLANVSTYAWSPASGLSCTNCASPNANPVAVTTYKVLITFTSGCTLEKELTVTPGVIATAKPDATICPGGSALLGSPMVPNVTYSWSVVSGTAGSINPTNAAQATANPTATSVYRLTATGTGPNAGCAVTDDVKVTVKALPAFTITGNTSVCTGGTVALSVSPVTPNVKYVWSPATGVATPDSSSTTIIPTATTTYRVTQTDINSGCSDYKEVVVSVHPNNVLATGGNITVCPASSATMPLTVSPATGNTIAWSPATYLDNPYAQNPTIAPQASGNYIATVTNNTTFCADTALVTITVPANCLGSDYGDAPGIYENGDPARHGIIATLKIGASTDAEGTPLSAILNAPATGDDNNSQINDEEGISFLPVPSNASKTLGLVVNDVLNNTGAPAYIVGWIDFNRDGDFNDAGEQSQVITLATSTAVTNPVLQFSRFNDGCLTVAGPSYLRVRLTTDVSGGWNITPSPVSARTNGEVEDYSIVIAGSDFGDAPAIYPAAKATVNPDLDANGEPDAIGSVWLGNVVDYSYSCDYLASVLGSADNNDFGINDEDGIRSFGYIAPNTTKSWHITVNSKGPVNGVQWGLWIDWNADGIFDNFHSGSANTSSPVIIPVSVTAAPNMVPNYVVRLGVKTGAAFSSTDFNYPITNGEWEDHVAVGGSLPVGLLSFTAARVNNKGVLTWETASEANSDHFTVLRSTDGWQWTEIGSLAAAGNSGSNRKYSLTDHQPAAGTNYYRLKMVDQDGSFQLSNIRVLDFGSSGNKASIYPNPAHGVTNLAFDKATTGLVIIKIWNHHGQLIKTYNVPGATTTHKLLLPPIPQGIYHVSVKGDGFNEHIKLVIQ